MQYGKGVSAWSLEIPENLKRFTNLRVTLARSHANLLCITAVLIYVIRRKTLPLHYI